MKNCKNSLTLFSILALFSSGLALADENKILEQVHSCISGTKMNTSWLVIYRDLEAEKDPDKEYNPLEALYKFDDLGSVYNSPFKDIFEDGGEISDNPDGIIYVIPDESEKLYVSSGPLDVLDEKQFEYIEYDDDGWLFSVIPTTDAVENPQRIVVTRPWDSIPGEHHLKLALVAKLRDCSSRQEMLKMAEKYYD